jgi:hypothetical protein
MPSASSRTFRSARAACAPLALVAAAPLAAQDSLPPVVRVDSGAVVRVTAPRVGLDRSRARAVASRGDSLTLVIDDRVRGDTTMRTVAWQDVTELALSGGRDRGAGARRGAAIGALVIAVPGAALTAGLLWYDWNSDRRNRCYEFCYLGPVVLGVMTVGGTGIGAITGALIGAGVGRERWTLVPIPARVGLVPMPNGLGVRLAF